MKLSLWIIFGFAVVGAAFWVITSQRLTMTPVLMPSSS